MKWFLTGIWLFLSLTGFQLSAQHLDSIRIKNLDEIVVSESRPTMGRLAPIQGLYIWAGKKNEVIRLQQLDANLAESTPRQILSRIPGLFVYDMDGTGNQMNIATRGLDAHRGWEYNNRLNGIITNSDMYGYPASHFKVPMEAVQSIELIRGTGSLQYGAQFGGLINYVLSAPDTTVPIRFITTNTIGSYGLLSNYAEISGGSGPWAYQIFYNRRVSSGYRESSSTKYDAQYALLRYQPSGNFSLTLELARSNYVYQLPGPLTDSMFMANPRSATRKRNYYQPNIFIPSVSLLWSPHESHRISWSLSSVQGSRNSVMFIKPATVKDDIIAATGHFAPRQVDIDRFNSWYSEVRYLHDYRLGRNLSTFVVGAQYTHNDLHRRQQGQGSTGIDYDLNILGGWGRDIHFRTQNIALMAENTLVITPKWRVGQGIRFENGHSDLSGKLIYYPDEKIPQHIKHRFPLLGFNFQYAINPLQNMYGGWSQAYRPVVLKDVVPGSIYDRTDPGLQDARGAILELGYRGSMEHWRWDVSVFRINYKRRLGVLAMIEDQVLYNYITNIGDAYTQGLEAYAEYQKPWGKTTISMFNAGAWQIGRYHHAEVKVGTENQSLNGNEVESVPHVINRTGLNIRFNRFSWSLLHSYTAKSFADPMNTVMPSHDGALGLVPAYSLWDLNGTWSMKSYLMFRLSINNFLDKDYFTKRPAFYPGPGIWPSDGRSVSFSVTFKL